MLIRSTLQFDMFKKLENFDILLGYVDGVNISGKRVDKIEKNRHINNMSIFLFHNLD